MEARRPLLTFREGTQSLKQSRWSKEEMVMYKENNAQLNNVLVLRLVLDEIREQHIELELRPNVGSDCCCNV